MKTKHSAKVILASAALVGMLGGTATRLQAAPLSSSAGQFADDTDKGIMTCSGGGGKKNKNGNSDTNNNTPSNSGTHACNGQNSCKGKGGCSLGDNGCKGKNSCKGKGGCATDGSK